MTADLPLVALDIDGVLNPLRDTDDGVSGGGYISHEVTLEAGSTYLPYLHGHGVESVSAQVLVSAEHGRWVRSLLAQGVEVAWATTWEHYANDVFGPLLGLPELPLAICYRQDVDGGHHHPRMYGLGAVEWKAEALWNKYPDRPLVWIDDYASELVRFDMRGERIERGSPSLAIACDRKIGLTRTQMNEVNGWLLALRSPSDEDG